MSAPAHLWIALTHHSAHLIERAKGEALLLDNCDADNVKGRSVIIAPSAAKPNGQSYAARKLRDLGAARVSIVSSLPRGALDLADLIETTHANGRAVDLDDVAAGAFAVEGTAGNFKSGTARIETLRAVTLLEFLALDIPIAEPLLAPLFTKQSLSLVYSWRGVGKTWFALGCAYAVASGGRFLRWKAPEAHRVLYLDGEMPAAALQRRLASIAAGSEAEASADFFKLVTPDLCGGLVPDLGSVEGQDAVDSLIKDTGADFIVVDNLSCWLRSGVENEAESWRGMAEWLLQHRSRGRSILLVHHAGKEGAQRGTSKKEDILDVSLDLRRPPTYEPEQGANFAVEFKKARHLIGADAESFEASLMIDDKGAACWTMTAVRESTFDRVIELAALGLSQKDIAEELGINKSNVSRHWNKAVESGRIKPKARAE